MKTGVLIINIGTPESYQAKDVGIYLKKFLMDKDVIALPYPLRWILVHLLIVPFRAVKSAAKYAKIWTAEGSPLKVNTERFVQKLQSTLTSNYSVKYGMAFSEPSIETSLRQFQAEQVHEIIICPMFPQYADATTGSVLKAVKRISARLNLKVHMKSIQPFYDQDFYINSMAAQCTAQPDHWIFSYHGLPEDQASAPTYRLHCERTTTALATRLSLKPFEYSMTFQSRLGVKKWLQPYTDDVLKSLAKRNIAVVSPAFVADCLETLEEINLESRQTFLDHGGEQFTYIPCLNDQADWVQGFANYLTDKKYLRIL